MGGVAHGFGGRGASGSAGGFGASRIGWWAQEGIGATKIAQSGSGWGDEGGEGNSKAQGLGRVAKLS